MAIQINAFEDIIKIDKAFVSGKDRIHVNGEMLFEGKLVSGKDRIHVNGEMLFEGKLIAGQPQRVSAQGRDYTIEKRSLGGFGGAFAIHLTVEEDGQPVGTGLFNQMGQPVTGEAQAKAAGGVQVCSMIGMGVGLAIMLTLNQTTRGAVPGGAIGGAIGGGAGGALGYGLGVLLFGSPSRK